MEIAILPTAVAFLLGCAVGVWGYRYMLKRNPALVARLANQVKDLGEEAQRKFDAEFRS